MTLSPRTIARSILRWDWLSCVSSAARRTRFMWGSNPSRIPRYPRPPFSSTITFELIRWLRRESGLIIEPRRSHGGGVLKGLREGRRAGEDRSRVMVESIRYAEMHDAIETRRGSDAIVESAVQKSGGSEAETSLARTPMPRA